MYRTHILQYKMKMMMKGTFSFTLGRFARSDVIIYKAKEFDIVQFTSFLKSLK